MKLLRIYKTGLLILISVIGITFSAHAQQKKHQVKTGETLFSIASQYNISVQNLKAWNNLADNELSVGQLLVVGPTKSADATTHTVAARETLFSISKQYDVSISEIKSWNNLSGNNLDIGQKLLIYAQENVGTEPNPDNSIVVSGNTQRNTYYTVKSGDTLYDIARAHRMTVAELKKLNDLSSNTLAIGQQLTVKETSAPPSVASAENESSPQGKFITYSISKTQSLQEILSRFEMDESEFRALNPDASASQFQRGQKVTVLAPPSKTYPNPYIASANLKDLGKTAIARYSDSEVGKTTTGGELYNPDELTAAHANIALGTIVYIENITHQKGIYIRINDRFSGNGLKLSDAAWNSLAIDSSNPSVNIYQDQ